jgi:D-alanyl-lipoteichoic acid acyltransferase DltB (MBOAT superfamily)
VKEFYFILKMEWKSVKLDSFQKLKTKIGHIGFPLGIKYLIFKDFSSISNEK